MKQRLQTLSSKYDFKFDINEPVTQEKYNRFSMKMIYLSVSETINRIFAVKGFKLYQHLQAGHSFLF